MSEKIDNLKSLIQITPKNIVEESFHVLLQNADFENLPKQTSDLSNLFESFVRYGQLAVKYLFSKNWQLKRLPSGVKAFFAYESL